MAARFEDRGWLARVSSADGVVKGAAWAIGREHVVTCAHVVQDAGASGPGECVRVDFPLLRAGCEAVVLAEGWAPAADDGMAGDVALLHLVEPPAGLETLPVRALRSLDGLDFSAYGFPGGYDNSRETHGTLGKAVGLERVQLEVGSALLVKPGFSGAAVWSDELGAVVGMLTSRDLETAGELAFAVPMRAIARHSSIVADAMQTPLDLDRDRATHWGPRSRGVRSDRDDAGWLFSGRAEALRELAGWLAEDRPPALRVVTGTPGSGKSAVLARLVTTADPHYRRRIPGLRADDPTVPPPGAFGVTFHARDRTLREFVDHVAALAQVTADNASTLLGALDEQDDRLVIAVDAVDEASESKELCWLLCDLAEHGNRVLVGCREHLVDQLSDPEPLRVDKPPYLDQHGVEAYVIQLLSRSAATGNEPDAEQLPRELATAAKGNFLVAQLTAQAVAVSGRVERPLPADVLQAFERLLADALPDADKARDLLLPLALAFGDGLPADVWLTGAEVLRRRYERGDLDDLLSSPAASFLITRLEAPGGRRYRLFHQALTGTLTRGRDLAADHRRLLDAWMSSLRETNGDGRWAEAAPYLRTHAADHAAAAGVLDRLIADPSFLVAADPNRLMLALPSLTSPVARIARTVYRRAVGALRSSPQAEHASYLEMEARKAGADDLAEQLARLQEPTRPWTVRWAHWQPHAEHFIIGRHAEHSITGSRICQVRAVALAELDGKPIAISGGDDGAVRVWDPATDAELGKPLTGHEGVIWNTGPVWAVAGGEVDGSPFAVSSNGYYGKVCVWDLATGGKRGEQLTDHVDTVYAVALGELDGSPIVITGSIDGTVQVSDLATGAKLGEPLTGHDDAVNAVTFGELDGSPIAVSGGDDGTVRVWDLATGAQLGEPLTGSRMNREAADGISSGVLDKLIRSIGKENLSDLLNQFPQHTEDARLAAALYEHAHRRVNAVAVGELDGSPIAVSGGDDGTVRIWDLATGAQRGEPLTGHDDAVYAVAFGELDGSPIAVSGGDDGTVRIWDLATGAQRGEPLTGHDSAVYAVAFGELDGSPIAITGGCDGTVRIWDLAIGAKRGEPPTGHSGPVRAVAFGELDGSRIAVSGGDDGTVRIWDLATGAKRGEPLTGHSGPVRAVAFGKLEDSPIAVSGGDDGTVRIWDLATGAQRGEPLTGHDRAVYAVAFGELDGSPIAISGGDDERAVIWELDAGAAHYQLKGHLGSVRALALGELDGSPIAITGDDSGTVRIWDLATRRPARPTSHLHGLVRAVVRAVAFGELDGSPIAITGGDDPTVRIWDLATDGERYELKGHLGSVGALALGELDGRPIAVSGGDDGTVLVWHPNGDHRSVVVGSFVQAVAFAPPSRTLVGATAGLMLIELFAV